MDIWTSRVISTEQWPQLSVQLSLVAATTSSRYTWGSNIWVTPLVVHPAGQQVIQRAAAPALRETPALPVLTEPWPSRNSPCRLSAALREVSSPAGERSTHLLSDRDDLAQKRYRLLGRHLQWPEKEESVLRSSRGQNEAQVTCQEVSQTLMRVLVHSARAADSPLNAHHTYREVPWSRLLQPNNL